MTTGDKHFYETTTLDGEVAAASRYIIPYTRNWLPRLRGEFAGRSDVRALDLGAGSCTVALTLSKEPFVREIVAADISEARMRKMSPEANSEVRGDLGKLSFAEIDFNDPLPFDEDSFDLVVMDAALHHSRNIWHTLSEIRRVLVPGGVFIAQREAYVPPLTHSIVFGRLLASPEAAAGVSENAYLKSQYDYYLRVNNFEPDFLPVYPERKFRLLAPLNGIAFAKYNIVAHSTKRRD